MSVYSRTNSAGKTIWRYDFQWGGARHFSTEPHYASRGRAETAERSHRKKLQRGAAEPAPQRRRPGAGSTTSDGAIVVTLDQACDRFWADVGRHHRSASDIERRLAIVRRIVGGDDKVRAGGIAAIRTATVIAAVLKRKSEERLTRWGKPSGEPVSNSSANRDIIDQLRPVLNHAAEIYEDDGLVLRAIKWKKARLKEAGEQVCEFSEDEVRRWGEELSRAAQRHGRDGSAERAFLTLALEYGPRLGELHFPPEAFRPDAPDGAELHLGRYIGKGGVVRESRKDGSLHEVPLLDDTVAMLAPLVDRARELGTATIWIEPDADGVWRPISYDAMRYRILSAAERAGIDKTRIVHGMRHHAGSAINRAGGLARVQQLLGHKQVTTSRRYAHTKKADLRADLEKNRAKKSRPSPAQVPPGGFAPGR